MPIRVKSMKLYKYRDTANIKYLLDIVINNRLYASSYNRLSDPMQGGNASQAIRLNSDSRELIRNSEDRYGICTLYEDPQHSLLWAHYADDHRGVAIGVTVDDPQCTLREVAYSDDEPASDSAAPDTEASVINLLSHKEMLWNYEREHRAFVKQKKFVDVKVHEVIFGSRVQSREKDFLTKMIQRINPDIEIKDAVNS